MKLNDKTTDEAGEETGGFMPRTKTVDLTEKHRQKMFSASMISRKCIVNGCKEDHSRWTCKIFKAVVVFDV